MHIQAITPDGKPLALPEIRFAQPQVAKSPVPYRFLPNSKSLVLEQAAGAVSSSGS